MEAENKRLCTEPKCYNAAVGTGLDSLITEKCPPTSEFTTEFASTLAPYFKYRSQSDIDKYPNCYQENGKYCYAEFSIALFDVNLNQTNKTALCSSCTKNLLNKFTASLNTGIGGVVNSNDEKDLNTTRALVMSKCGNDFFSTSGSVSGSSSTSTSGSASLISMNVMHFAVVATMGIFMVL
ncbi:hypothetical protein HK098_003856 [Nowakowskiella sp. JEL0407]|nr:hypothetical protein HK098_003856 [Nowakowskiella sp. JEL0407]